MTIKTMSAALALVALASAPALAQQPKGGQPSASAAVNCAAHHASPQLVEGQVMKVDHSGGTITVKGKDGATHEFKASKETLADMKPGDQIEARLRPAPNC